MIPVMRALYVDAAMRVVGASTAMRAATGTVSVTVVVCLSVVCLAVGAACAVSVEPGQDGGEEEEDAVHDAKGETSFEHGAGLVHSGVDAVVGVSGTEGPKVYVKAAAGVDVDAVGGSYVTQIPDRGDEGPDETQVDDRHEERIVRRAVVTEQGEDGPSQTEHRNNEQDQNIVWCQRIVFNIAVDEPSKHAHGWDQCEDLHKAPKGEEDCEQHDDR